MAKVSVSNFYKACRSGKTDVVENLLNSGIDPNICHDSSNIYLHVAVRKQHFEVVKLLLHYGADPNQLSSLGISPLHLACRDDKEKINEILDFSCENYAENRCDLDMMKILVDFGAEINIRNSAGDSPMSYVFGANHIKEIKAFFENVDGDGFELLQCIGDFRKNQKDKLEFLLSHGADVHAVYNNGNTILHVAIEDLKESRQILHLDTEMHHDYMLAEIIELFLLYEADVNAKNNEGQSPLQLAVAFLSYDIVKVLLNYNAHITDIQFDYFLYPKDITPCLRATDNLLSIIETLINKGFYLDQRENLNILKFFIFNNNSHFNYHLSKSEETLCRIKHLLKYDTDSHIELDLEKLVEIIASNSDVKIYRYLKDSMTYHICNHLGILESTNLYASEEIKDFLRSTICCLEPSHSATIRSKYFVQVVQHEIACMKDIELSASTSLYDILSINPKHSYWRIKRNDHRSILSSEEFTNEISALLGIVEGLFAKCLVRRYIVESARAYLTTLIDLSLPDPCCYQIFVYLCNESLLNMCEAVFV